MDDKSKSAGTGFPSLPVCGITFPSNRLLLAALEYSKKHTSPTVVSHCLRVAAFALLCIRKVPDLAAADKDLVVYACLMHDMGWATTPALISKDKRFEVDGANTARDWIFKQCWSQRWDERQTQLVWDAIALHSTPSIARHKEPEVAATAMGVACDFFGSNMPGGIVSAQEHDEIVALFPRLGLHDEIVRIVCGLCREKPETTYDNNMARFGIMFGLDGAGSGKDEFAKRVEERNAVGAIMSSLKALEAAGR